MRAWVNIGQSYWNQGDYHSAARFYLCALSLNEGADHIVNLVETAFKAMEREDLLEKLEARDPALFADEFHVVMREELPS